MNSQYAPSPTYNHRSQQEESSRAYVSGGPAQQSYQPGEPVRQMLRPEQSYQAMPQQNAQVFNERQDFGQANGVVRTTDMGPLHSESRSEVYRDPMGYLVQSRQQVYEDQNQVRNTIRYRFTTGITFFFSLLETILLLRFVFRLLGANRDAGFITLLYGLSHPFVAAFNGIFNDQTLSRASVFEASTLVAMLIYALLAWGLITLVAVLFAPARTSRQSVTTTRRSQF